MVGMIDEEKALKTLDSYYTLLGKTGYVKSGVVKKYLIYLFLLEFVDLSEDYITEEDYNKIDKVLHRLFSHGGCLLPYPVFCANRATLGRNWYIGRTRLRITQAREGRSTEDLEHVRIG